MDQANKIEDRTAHSSGSLYYTQALVLPSVLKPSSDPVNMHAPWTTDLSASSLGLSFVVDLTGYGFLLQY